MYILTLTMFLLVLYYLHIHKLKWIIIRQFSDNFAYWKLLKANIWTTYFNICQSKFVKSYTFWKPQYISHYLLIKHSLKLCWFRLPSTSCVSDSNPNQKLVNLYLCIKQVSIEITALFLSHTGRDVNNTLTM